MAAFSLPLRTSTSARRLNAPIRRSSSSSSANLATPAWMSKSPGRSLSSCSISGFFYAFYELCHYCGLNRAAFTEQVVGGHHTIDKPVLDGLGGGQVVLPVDVLEDLLLDFGPPAACYPG